MFVGPETVRVTVTCRFCDTRNDLTINHVDESQKVICSACGGKLGTVAELLIPDATLEKTGARTVEWAPR